LSGLSTHANVDKVTVIKLKYITWCVSIKQRKPRDITSSNS
jgi:hypothetical protein